MSPWLSRLLASAWIIPADRIQIPLKDRVEQDSLHLWADAFLLVQGQGDRFAPFRWRVDSGATLTRINWKIAVDAGFPTDQAEPPVTVREKTAAGSRQVNIRRGTIRVLLHERQRAAPFSIPIWYVIDPFPTALLGLGGVVDQLRWVIDGRNRGDDFPNGYCLLKDCRPVRDRFPG